MTALDVGGDFFDFYPVEGGAIVTVAGVMGKGLGAAILAASVRGPRALTKTLMNSIPARSPTIRSFAKTDLVSLSRWCPPINRGNRLVWTTFVRTIPYLGKCSGRTGQRSSTPSRFSSLDALT